MSNYFIPFWAGLKTCATSVALAICVACAGTTAEAQTRREPPRTHLSVSAGYEPTSNRFVQETTAFSELAEEGSFTAGYQAGRAPGLDVTVVHRFGRTWGMGVAVSMFLDSSTADVHARVPHPFLFERHRESEGASPRLRRGELSVHPLVAMTRPLSARLEMTAFGGPSLFRINQQLLSGIRVEESYPFDEAVIAGGTHVSRTGFGIGFHVGADVTYRWTPTLGAGVLVRFRRGSVKLQTPDGQEIAADPRGVQTVAGLRFAF